MPSNSTGKWVARAASTGGGKTYRGQMPINWYASLVIIVIVGLLLVGYSRYQRTHKVNNSTGPPTTTQTWHTALGIDICGTIEPNLPASTNTAKTGLTADGTGLVIITPKNSSESGANATLGKFVSGYKGLTLSSTTLGYPGKKVMSNGATCPKGTPDAGKQGFVNVVDWTNYLSKTSTSVQGNPTSLKFGDGQMITMAFLPATAKVPKPPGTVVQALITAVQTGATATTTTTTVPGTATTAPATATTAPATATTAPATATTTPTATTAAPTP
ncbi:MAG TPA: hypothetical protein VG412_01500 [Acidimicrobiales bacterium]|jgi:hypothetical protein|nr:hypothetical protein [Acidimicrobiales bacterium]